MRLVPALLILGVCLSCGRAEPPPAPGSNPGLAVPLPRAPEPASGAQDPARPPADATEGIELELATVEAFDLRVALPPSVQPMLDPPPDSLLFHDPDTGWVFSVEKKGGRLYPAPELGPLAVRAARNMGAERDPEPREARLGEVTAVQVDFEGAEASTSLCVGWRNGSIYLLAAADASREAQGLSELVRMLCAAAAFTSEQEAPPAGGDPLAALGVRLPGARGLPVAGRVDGGAATITDAAAGFVTVLVGFPAERSPYRGLDEAALRSRLEGEGCGVAAMARVPVGAAEAHRVRCELGGDGPKREFALVHVVPTAQGDWVVSVVGKEEAWPAQETYADRLLQGAVLP